MLNPRVALGTCALLAACGNGGSNLSAHLKGAYQGAPVDRSLSFTNATMYGTDAWVQYDDALSSVDTTWFVDDAGGLGKTELRLSMQATSGAMPFGIGSNSGVGSFAMQTPLKTLLGNAGSTITKLRFTGDATHPLEWTGTFGGHVAADPDQLDLAGSFVFVDSCADRLNRSQGIRALCGPGGIPDGTTQSFDMSGPLPAGDCPAEVVATFASGAHVRWDGSSLSLGAKPLSCVRTDVDGVLCGAEAAGVRAAGCAWTVEAIGAPSMNPRQGGGPDLFWIGGIPSGSGSGCSPCNAGYLTP